MNSSGDKMSLEQAMNELGESVVQAREALAKSTSTLEAVHKQVLPHNPLPGVTSLVFKNLKNQKNLKLFQTICILLWKETSCIACIII